MPPLHASPCSPSRVTLTSPHPLPPGLSNSSRCCGASICRLCSTAAPATDAQRPIRDPCCRAQVRGGTQDGAQPLLEDLEKALDSSLVRAPPAPTAALSTPDSSCTHSPLPPPQRSPASPHLIPRRLAAPEPLLRPRRAHLHPPPPLLAPRGRGANAAGLRMPPAPHRSSGQSTTRRSRRRSSGSGTTWSC
jgi:hypothetical protein